MELNLEARIDALERIVIDLARLMPDGQQRLARAIRARVRHDDMEAPFAAVSDEKLELVETHLMRICMRVESEARGR